MQVYIFKAKDYTTVLVGQMAEDKCTRQKYFFVQRGDGTIYKYDEDRIEYFHKIYDDETFVSAEPKNQNLYNKIIQSIKKLLT